MIDSMFTWLIEQQLILSILLLSLILFERFGLTKLNPKFVYKLVLLIPIALVIRNLPDTLKPLQNSQITFYLISPNTHYLKDMSWLWLGIYLVVSAVLFVVVAFAHLHFIQSLSL